MEVVLPKSKVKQLPKDLLLDPSPMPSRRFTSFIELFEVVVDQLDGEQVVHRQELSSVRR